MRTVRTVLGDINPKDMGVTDAHDHLIRTGGLEVLKDRDFLMDNVDKAVQEAQYFAAGGGKTLVDMGAVSLGRDIRKLVEVAKRVPVHIIAATGFHMAEFYDTRIHWMMKYTVDQIVEFLVADVQQGIDIHDYMGPIVERSKARAGVIKVATSYGHIAPFELKAIQTVALAQKETGALISTHAQFGTMALEQVELLKKYGANPERIVVGHVQRNPDLWYHKKIAATGASVMYDGAYRIKYLPDSSRVELIRGMIKAGYGKHIVLGVDAGRASYQKVYGGGVGIDYDVKVFLPRLREEGIPEEAIQDIFVNNPARLFAMEA
jgi:predicted metal-dependent phosphotriesterase family hydrolase